LGRLSYEKAEGGVFLKPQMTGLYGMSTMVGNAL
jgi:hypothetical protein